MQDGTLKITQISDHKAAQVAAKFTITATLEGFPFTVEAEGKADDLRALVSRLKAIGAQPPKEKVMENLPQPISGAPTCEYHGAMKRSNHGGFYCPKKMGDGGYCKSKA